MNRRDVLKSLGVIALSAGLPGVMNEFIVSCRATEKPKPQFFSPKEFALLETVVDIILPRTKTPGGLDTQTPVFIDRVVKDCMSREDQERIRKGLRGLLEQNGRPFSKLGRKEKAEIIRSVDEKAFKDDAESVWLRIVKKLALIGHFTSREGMTKALNYVKIPGHYEACIPYKKGDKAMAKTFLMYW
ncbi:MAG: gluconate 2-dehydrogenase subunit 3 family protein [Pyrinomonadaceae bacterium]